MPWLSRKFLIRSASNGPKTRVTSTRSASSLRSCRGHRVRTWVAAFSGFEIIVEDPPMVEGQRQAPVAGIEDDGRPGVVGAPGIARRPGPRRPSRSCGSAGRGRGPSRRRAGRGARPRARSLRGPPGRRPLRASRRNRRSRPGSAQPGGGFFRSMRTMPRVLRAVPDLDDDVDGRERVAELRAGHRDLSAFAVIVVVFRVKAKKRGRVPVFRPSSPSGDRSPEPLAWSFRRAPWHEKC